LGIFNINKDMAASNSGNSNFERGKKLYELSNHLGNVLVTISDKNIQHTSNSTVIDYYSADIITANDYYPGGMVQPSRKFTAGTGYRYGFNGMEKDNSTGEGNLDFGARIYDARVGRFLSVDKATGTLPMLSPYAYCGNNPIANIDRDGNDYELRIFVDDNGKPQIEITSSWKVSKGASQDALKAAMGQWTALNGTKVKLNDVEFTVTVKFQTEVVDKTAADLVSGLQDGENAYIGNYKVDGEPVTPKIVKDKIVVTEKDGTKNINNTGPGYKDANTNNGMVVNSYVTTIQPDLSGLSAEDKVTFSDYISKLKDETSYGTDASSLSHEIGHTLGLSHNGQYNGGSSRRDADNNVTGTSTFNASGTMAGGSNVPNAEDLKNVLREAFQNGGTSSTGGLPNSRSVVTKTTITPEAAKKINNSDDTKVDVKTVRVQ
jgi:RHS repeat-associated protein